MNRKIFILFLCVSLLIPKNHKQTLGRNKDPKKVSDISNIDLSFRKTFWEFITGPGLRFITDLVYPESTISYIDTQEGAVAFTIDDGFCGIDNPDGSMLEDVRKLFKKYNANATFFITGSHCNHTNKEDVLNLLNDGHELANHGMYDWAYNKYSEEEFGNDLFEVNSILSNYTSDISNWYRAPHAKLSKTMQKVLDENGLTHVVCDAFAGDTAIPDSKWIARYILHRVQSGSIILIHMPEKGVREWLYEAMELTLKGLKELDLEILTVTELYERRNDYK